jgi:hypothetical protein
VIDFGGSELVVGNRDEEEDEVPDEDMPVDDDMEEEFINDQGDVDEDANVEDEEQEQDEVDEDETAAGEFSHGTPVNVSLPRHPPNPRRIYAHVRRSRPSTDSTPRRSSGSASNPDARWRPSAGRPCDSNRAPTPHCSLATRRCPRVRAFRLRPVDSARPVDPLQLLFPRDQARRRTGSTSFKRTRTTSRTRSKTKCRTRRRSCPPLFDPSSMPLLLPR